MANLQSEQRLKIIDVLSEGQIAGLKNGWQSVYLDGTPLQNPDGTFNADSVKAFFRTGTNRQDVVPDNDGLESVTGVGLELKAGQNVVRSINNTDVDSVRITVSVGALYQQNQQSGEFDGTSVDVAIDIQNNGTGFVNFATVNFTGKSMSKFQKEIKLSLPDPGPWDVRVRRVNPDSTNAYLVNSTFWDSYGEVIEQRFYMPYSAYCSLDLPARAYANIPRRNYNILGRRVLVPTNYNPVTAVYSGVWDGSFKDAYSNNPAWVFYDMAINVRYGLGQFIGMTNIDKWALYEIARWCDELVPDGKGGVERRWTVNAVINSQQEAFNLFGDMASAFRGMLFCELGSMRAVADMPSEPVAMFSQANVIDGKFSYAGTDYRARHTVAMVGWNDPEGLGQSRIAYVEDREGIDRFGIIETSTTAFGCTSEAMAARVGRHILFTERMETETVSFDTTQEACFIYPGAVIQISDAIHAGERRAGRIARQIDPRTIQLDAPVTFDAANTYTIAVVMADQTIQRQTLLAMSGEQDVVQCEAAAFAGTIRSGAMWMISSSDLVPTLWRVTGITEGDQGRMAVTALAYSPGRFAEIEYGIKVSDADTSNVQLRPPPVTDLKILEELYLVTSVQVGERVVLTWVSRQPRYLIRYRKDNDNFTDIESSSPTVAIPVAPGVYDFEVYAVNALGVRSVPVSRRQSVVGRTAPPKDVIAFGLQPSGDIGMFTWNPSDELDVIVGGRYEIRWSPDLTGVQWPSAIPVMVSVPGSAVSVEMPLRVGTYLIKPQDSLGNYAINPAILVTTYVSVTDIHNIYQTCDHPEFAGQRINLEWREDLESLVIGNTGNLWDAVTYKIVPGGMNDWANVDILPVVPQTGSGGGGSASGPNYKGGTYYMKDILDIGGVFTTRLSCYLRAYPYKEGEGFFDDRLTPMDTWPDFDQVGADADARAQVYISQTDDPPEGWDDANGHHDAVWTPWQPFTIGNYTGRAFKFRCDLTAEIGSNIALNEICVSADLKDKFDSDNDVAYPGSKIHIAYRIGFYLPPSVGITLQNGHSGDRIEVTNKTVDGFDLEVFDSSGAQAIGRSFDWIASGM